MTTLSRNKNTTKFVVSLIVIAGTCLWSPTDLRSVESKTSSAQPSKYNRLIGESSPYLQQHATNPINWFPWGDEAFEKAAKKDKPIFLSIGYSTCHWCHAMEHESFSVNLGCPAMPIPKTGRKPPSSFLHIRRPLNRPGEYPDP